MRWTPPVDAGPAHDLDWTPAWRLAEMIARRERPAVEVVEHCLGRIAALDPKLHAFSHLDAQGARAQALAADAAVARGDPLGPLHGVPVGVKASIAVEGLEGHPDFTGRETRVARRDAIVVERLRAAGAVIVGLTATPGMGRRRGEAPDPDAAPRNPWDLTRVPGSSSAGSAGAVAGGLVPVAIGGDDGGSTRLPSALSGVFGFHASRGRVPEVDVERPAHSLTQSLGPVTRDVRDAALVMGAIAGPDGRQFITLDAPAPDYMDATGRGAEGLRMAWTDDFGFGSLYALPQSPRVVAAVREAAMGFRTLGARVTPTDEVWEDFWPGNAVTGRSYGYSTAVEGRPLPTPDELAEALARRERNHARFRRLFEDVDVLLCPTAPFTAFTVEDWDRAWNLDGARYPHGTFAPTYTQNTYGYNWLGWPAMTVPCGLVDGLPVGLEIAAPPHREAVIFQAAAAFDRAFVNP